jgi:hypothetical protein
MQRFKLDCPDTSNKWAWIRAIPAEQLEPLKFTLDDVSKDAKRWETIMDVAMNVMMVAHKLCEGLDSPEGLEESSEEVMEREKSEYVRRYLLHMGNKFEAAYEEFFRDCLNSLGSNA